MFNFRVWTWTAAHWATVAGTTAGAAAAGAVVSYLETVPSAQLLTDLTTPAGLYALGHGAIVVGAIAALTAIANMAKQMLPADAQAAANALRKGQVP